METVLFIPPSLSIEPESPKLPSETRAEKIDGQKEQIRADETSSASRVRFIPIVALAMGIFICAVLSVIFLGWLYFSNRPHKLQGEVFIVTRGGESIKLGLVEVGLYPTQVLMPYLEEKKAGEKSAAAQLDADIEAAYTDQQQKRNAFESVGQSEGYGSYAAGKAAQESQTAGIHLDALRETRRHFPSGSYYFQNLPGPTGSVETDADGKFEMMIPAKGEFAMVAQAQRNLGDEVERYYWIVKIPKDQTGKIMLSNQNLSSSGSENSLIFTMRE
jgi:hypothetical protein